MRSFFSFKHFLFHKFQSSCSYSIRAWLIFVAVKKYFEKIKNKYIIATIIFLVYTLFLDDTDIFTIVNHNIKLRKLEQVKEETAVKLESTTSLLKKLRYEDALESYARETKLFKLENEDIFIISYE